MTTILGLIIIYSWVHSIVILVNKEKESRTPYEKFLLIFALTTVILCFVGLTI